jgi:hypothetical protein
MKRRFENISFDDSKEILEVEYYYGKDLEFRIKEIPRDEFIEFLRMIWGNLSEWVLVESFNNEQDHTRESIVNQYMDTLKELI